MNVIMHSHEMSCICQIAFTALLNIKQDILKEYFLSISSCNDQLQDGSAVTSGSLCYKS